MGFIRGGGGGGGWVAPAQYGEGFERTEENSPVFWGECIWSKKGYFRLNNWVGGSTSEQSLKKIEEKGSGQNRGVSRES